MVARGWCAYTVLDGGGVPPARRKAFALGQARRWVPFSDPAFHVEWIGDRAMVWAWSLAAVLAPARDADERAPRRMLPESLYRGSALATGAELVAMDEGVEARAWRDGVLLASTWWPAAPDLVVWNGFRRGAGLPATHEVPTPQAAPLDDAGWARRAAGGSVDFGRYRTTLVPVALGLAVAVLCAPVGSTLRILAERARIDRAIARQDALVHDIRVAREAAERDSAVAGQLLALRPPAGQVRLLSALVQGLPAGWKLLEWRMPDPSSLEAVVQIPSGDPRALVRTLEGSPALEAVSVNIGQRPDEMVIKATVAGDGS
ncbi:hypothetical protein PAGU2595_003180 [Lysobacter xanthus]